MVIKKPCIKKGDKIYIEGKLKTRSWQDQEGNNRYTTEVIADNMTMLGKVSDNNNNSNDAKEEKAIVDDFSGPNENDDLPF